jgi:hypothetical protein
MEPRPIREIAREIRREWKNVNYAAEPYLAALEQLGSINDVFYCDSAWTVIIYFLANATAFRGPKARELKAELKALKS